MPVSRPIPVSLPTHGVAFAESVHGPRFRMAERSDPFHKLIYVLHGRVTFSSANTPRAVQASAGAVICVREGIRHQLADAAPPTLLLLCFSTEFVNREPGLAAMWRGLFLGDSACLRPGRAWGQRFETLWRSATVEQSGAQAGREIVIGAAAAQILVSLARLPKSPAADSSDLRVEAIAREMAETFYEPWNLERGCTGAGMSRRQFSKLFRASIGRTFLEHLTELRLTHAATLLRAGRHSVVGAAFSSGYGDLSHFYRLFRARYGQPPAQWAGSPGRGV